MKSLLSVGAKHRHQMMIEQIKTVPHLYPEDPHFKAMPPVFATGFMVGMIEITCMQMLSACLERSEGSVGIHIDVSHEAPTPVGMLVTVSATVRAIEGRKVTWDVVVKDEEEIIGRGTHQRFVVDLKRFIARVQAKAKHIV